MANPVVYVDVDDTLVRSAGTKRIPIPTAIERVRSLHREGAVLYLWSAAGAAYAESTAKELAIATCFAGFLPKLPSSSMIRRWQSGEVWSMSTHSAHRCSRRRMWIFNPAIFTKTADTIPVCVWM